MLKKGDLFELNNSGKELFKHCSGSIGIIVSPPRLLYEYDFDDIDKKKQYYVFDILVSGLLFTDIPNDFLERIIVNEKDIERME